jgi:DNA-binding CsgD family transcriptional regulator
MRDDGSMNHLDVHSFVLRPGEPVLLSPRQRQIVDLLLQGCENAEIAKVLKMNRRTVKGRTSIGFSCGLESATESSE